MMASFLRDIPDGERFMLCRSGQRYRLVRRERVKGTLRHVVLKDGSEREGTLHHSCRVKPVVRAMETTHQPSTFNKDIMTRTSSPRLEGAIAAAPAQQFRYAMHTLRVIADGVPQPGRYAELALQHITCGAASESTTLSGTPRSDRLEATRLSLGQVRTPAYGDAIRLCQTLESEVARLTAELAQVRATQAESTPA
jgi:hypothetical protein